MISDRENLGKVICDVASLENIDAVVEFEMLGDGSQGDPYSPVIYLHPNTQNCKAYRPTSLSRVLINEYRTLSVAEISNEKCPQELPDNNPQEPEPDSPKNRGLLLKLRNKISAIKRQVVILVHTILDAVFTQLRVMLISSYH